jgi:hypothetical protein
MMQARREHNRGGFSPVSEMKQNPASFARILSMICRIESKRIKYRETWLNAKGKRA